MKNLFLIILISSLSMISFAADEVNESAMPQNKVPAIGSDPQENQNRSDEVSQAGVHATGAAAPGTQAATCPGCEQRNSLLLLDNSSALPGVSQDTSLSNSAKKGN